MKAKVQAATRRRGRNRRESWRTLVTLLVLITFSLQGFLIQTHIHNLPVKPPVAGGLTIFAPPDGKAPLDMDKCFLCQEYVHAGAYLTPAVLAVLPPFAAVSLVASALKPRIAAPPTSHNWIGRAPPRA